MLLKHNLNIFTNCFIATNSATFFNSIPYVTLATLTFSFFFVSFFFPYQYLSQPKKLSVNVQNNVFGYGGDGGDGDDGDPKDPWWRRVWKKIKKFDDDHPDVKYVVAGVIIVGTIFYYFPVTFSTPPVNLEMYPRYVTRNNNLSLIIQQLANQHKIAFALGKTAVPLDIYTNFLAGLTQEKTIAWTNGDLQRWEMAATAIKRCGKAFLDTKRFIIFR